MLFSSISITKDGKNMNSKKPNNQSIFSPPQQLNIQQAFTSLLNHCSSFQTSISQFQNNTKQTVDTIIARFNPVPSSSSKNPMWARIPPENKTQQLQSTSPMSAEAIEERLAGVPVYALSNSNEEFVLVSGVASGKSLGLFCFKQADAEALLDEMKGMDPAMKMGGSKVVPVALNKVFQLKLNGVAFRLIPEASQVKNAIRVRETTGVSDDDFNGVPVFQSRSLVLKSQDKSYRPVFFRKEDLEKSLLRASQQQKRLNPVFRQGDIQVAAFENIIKDMKEGSTSTWEDIVFIPPGFDVSTDPTQQRQ